MSDWWVTSTWQQSPVIFVSQVVWVIGSIVLHELAHGVAAIWRGDRTPIETGHMTWNPLVHMGQASLIMFALFGIAWGQMPVDRSRLRGPYSDALVSIAGPIMNLILFCIALAASAATVVYLKRLGDPLGPNLFMFFITGAYLNLALMIFNLLPVPPLDGSRILGDIVPAYSNLWNGPNAQFVGLAAFAAVFLFGGKWAFQAADHVTVQALDVVLQWLGHTPLGGGGSAP